jgi:hypothetical protein
MFFLFMLMWYQYKLLTANKYYFNYWKMKKKVNKRIDNSHDLKFNSVNLRDFRWRDQCTFIILFIYTEHIFI